jgi:anti-sigma-K factor RskA
MSRHPTAEDLAAYAIGGLDPREERSVERHVGRCEDCAAELEHLAPAVAVLAESVEQHEPPAQLRQSLLAAVREDAESAGEPRRTGPAGFLLRPVAGLAAVALIAAAGVGYLVAGSSENDPAKTVALSGMSGELVVEDGKATLEMKDVEQLDEKGSVYQVWVADPSGVEPSAAFVPRQDGTATAAVPEAAGDATQVMITREPMPGRQQPSGPVLANLSL